MTTYLFKNNAVSTLAASMGLLDTSLTVGTGHGSRFPAPGAGQAFVVTVQNGSDYEIMTCTSRTGDVLTVTRGVDGTTAQLWDAGSSVDVRIPAIILTAFAQSANVLALAGGTMTGPLLLDDTVSLTTPPLAFDGDGNTGLAHSAADTLSLVTGGGERLRASSSGVEAFAPFLAPAGSETAPSVTFATDQDTGFYRAGSNSVGFSAGGTNRLTINATTMTVLLDFAVVGDLTLVGNVALDGSLAATGSFTAGAYLQATTYVLAGTYLESTSHIKSGTYIDATTYITMGTPGTSGNRAVAYSQFPATLGTAGTSTLPNGDIRKWGTGTTTSGAGSVTFPVPFPTACDNVQLTIVGGSAPVNLHPLVRGDKDANGFFVFGGIGESLSFEWVAIGH